MDDARGLAVSTDAEAVIAGIDRFTDGLLAAQDAGPAIVDLAARHPDCGLVQLYAAAMHICSQSAAQITADAQPLIARAARRRAMLNEREALHLEMIGAWAAGELQRAIALAERIAERWPRDIVAAKLAEFLFFEAPDYQRHLRFMARIAPAHEQLSHFHAMHAFALELAGHYADAERVALRGITLDPYTPWAHHALGHLYLNTGRLADGIRAFEQFAPTWSRHGHVMQCHNVWHFALFYLADRQLDRAAALCRERIWGIQPDSVFEQVDAIALLWRLDLAAAPVEDLWTAIAAHVAPHAGEPVFPFLTAHVVYALARAGRAVDARAATAALAAHAAQQRGEYRRLWGEIALPLVEGCRAFAEGAYAQAATLLEPIAGEVVAVGGSDAQNDLFQQTLLVALLESGRRGEAAALLDCRTAHRPASPLEQAWRARTR